MRKPDKRGAPDDRNGGSARKKKKGNNGKWKVPKSEGSDRPKANAIEPGDMGIWVTCPMHVKGKAAREMEMLFDHYAEKFYGIKVGNADADDSDEGEGDIESAIKREVGDLKSKDKSSSDSLFTEVRINQECILFMKCKAPVEPVDFCRRICQDVLSPDCSSLKARYLNRLTPISVIANATETGLEKASRHALADHFKLKPKETITSADSTTTESATDDCRSKVKEADDFDAQPAKFAIRPSIRNHNSLQRDQVIKSIAKLVDPQHKVNLGAPDKVILVEIYQSVFGISVVPGDWEVLKRYNLTALYKQVSASNDASEAKENDEVKELFGELETSAET